MLTLLRKDFFFYSRYWNKELDALSAFTNRQEAGSGCTRDRRKSFSETINLLQGLSRMQARQLSWTLLEPGCTVYFPCHFLHSVWTDVQPGSVCTMYSCERTVEEGWRIEQVRRADHHLALGCRWGRFWLQFLIKVCISVFFNSLE